MPLKNLLISVFLFLFSSRNFAQSYLRTDTISITIADAENLFLQRNFLLLAAKYQVSEADATIIQAKLYPNPNLSIDQGVYNQDTKKKFDLGKTGETAASLQQVILLAGKRNMQVNIAKINSQISTYQFYDLIRTLRYELRSSFYGLYFLQRPLTVYDKEIGSLKTLIDVYTTQYNKGNIAFKELARLQALQFSLQNERLDLLKQVEENQADLILLTGDTLSRPIKTVADSEFINRINVSNLNYSQLLDSALINRYDLKRANAQVQLNQTNLALQKALRVPDLTLGANYDKAGSYVRNYNSLSLAINLPFWNRNQGNIKAAQFQIEESKQMQSQAELQVRNDIRRAYAQLLETDKLYKTTSLQFTADYEKLLDGIIKGYQNHTISLLEFIDYYETYKNSKLEFNRLQNNRVDALENLNLATGTIILK
ncbi:MAG TPA: TolC family protein [Chitinophagaceae bacterium]|nr:TolC family protein [Chitinophagaceae bacterium]